MLPLVIQLYAMQQDLYMLLLGCKPANRFTEQHDIFFGIASSLKELVPSIIEFWPEAEGNIHLDAWRKVTVVDGHRIHIVPKTSATTSLSSLQLFFLNLGGYKENDFEEYHYKLLVVAEDKATAISRAKKTAFFKHNYSSHIDDKYGVDVDDIYEIGEILPQSFKDQYNLQIASDTSSSPEDDIHPEYIKLSKLI